MGGEAKVTVMVLNVDLGCKKCYRKIKKVLCSTPQIRDQMFDKNSNTVTISVICCSPENVAKKICSKAGGTIKGLNIKPTNLSAKPPGGKPKEGGGPPSQTKPAAQPKQVPPIAALPKSNGGNDGKPTPAHFPMPPPAHFPMPPPPMMSAPRPNQPAAFMSPETIPVAGYPSIFPPVVYSDGGSYYQNQGMAAMAAPQRFPYSNQPVYQYDGYTGRPVGDYYPSTCSLM